MSGYLCEFISLIKVLLIVTVIAPFCFSLELQNGYFLGDILLLQLGVFFSNECLMILKRIISYCNICILYLFFKNSQVVFIFFFVKIFHQLECLIIFLNFMFNLQC